MLRQIVAQGFHPSLQAASMKDVRAKRLRHLVSIRQAIQTNGASGLSRGFLHVLALSRNRNRMSSTVIVICEVEQEVPLNLCCTLLLGAFAVLNMCCSNLHHSEASCTLSAVEGCCAAQELGEGQKERHQHPSGLHSRLLQLHCAHAADSATVQKAHNRHQCMELLQLLPSFHLSSGIGHGVPPTNDQHPANQDQFACQGHHEKPHPYRLEVSHTNHNGYKMYHHAEAGENS
mmetsp:Transcript_18941/g.41690  ORF Transcript_18941/g.41690 Transcript_18941/m.41690 type:complete len:232 (+) Transcript_18941:179-874(+)